MGTKKKSEDSVWETSSTNVLLFFSKAKQSKGKNREQPATIRLGHRDRNFLLSVEVGELMVSSSKLWPLAVSPIIHGGSTLPLHPTASMSLSVCVRGKSSLHWKVNTFSFSAKSSLPHMGK